MAAFGAVAFMLVAGWQFGMGSTEAPFSEKEVALEKAIARSGGPGASVVCYDSELVGGGPYRHRVCVKDGSVYCEFDDHGEYTLGTCNF
ncbi:hypothetical protein GCM10027284_04700 [Cyclobacterium sediminis]